MGNPVSFDEQYGLNTTEEQNYLKTNTIENLKKEFGGDLKKLERSIIVNYHTENLNKVSLNQINTIKKTTGARYNELYHLKTGGSDGIAALQILAIVCVETMQMNNDETKKVADILASEYVKSDSVDGILGPNTLFLLKKIANTTLGGDPITDWNGVINDTLINKMLNICGNVDDNTPKTDLNNTITETPDQVNPPITTTITEDVNNEKPNDTSGADVLPSSQEQNIDRFGFYLKKSTIKKIDTQCMQVIIDNIGKEESYDTFIANLQKIFFNHLDLNSLETLDSQSASDKVYTTYLELVTGNTTLNKFGFWIVAKQFLEANHELQYNSTFNSQISSTEREDMFNNANVSGANNPGKPFDVIQNILQKDPGFASSKVPIQGFEDFIDLYNVSLNKLYQ